MSRWNLSADVFFEARGGGWTAVICNHPPQGGDGAEVWRKDNMHSAYNAETAMEAAWTRIMKSPHPETPND